MKRFILVYLLFYSLGSEAQTANLAIEANTTKILTSGSFENVIIGANGKLVVNGVVQVNSIVGTRNAPFKIIVSGLGDLTITENLVLDGSDTLFNAGSVRCKSIMLQRDYNLVKNIANFYVQTQFNIDFGINKVYNEGRILISQGFLVASINVSGWGYVHPEEVYESSNCATISADYMTINSNNPFSGKGYVWFYNLGISNGITLTKSPLIYISKQNEPLLPDKKWGSGLINAHGQCKKEPSLLTILQSSFSKGTNDGVKFELTISHPQNMMMFTIEQSDDRKNWTQAIDEIIADRLSNSYSGIVK